MTKIMYSYSQKHWYMSKKFDSIRGNGIFNLKTHITSLHHQPSIRQPIRLKLSNGNVSTACETIKQTSTPQSALTNYKFKGLPVVEKSRQSVLNSPFKNSNFKRNKNMSLLNRSIALDEIDDFRNLSFSS